MLIRKANSSDSKFIAPLVIQAMEDMAKEFTQSDDLDKALDLFTHFISQKGNQYSYENTLIAIENGEVAGAISAYDGGKLKEFRKPFLDFLKMNFDYKEIPEDETQSGEYYLDTVSVSPHHQGKGIGGKLIEAMIEKAKSNGFQKVGLLVDIRNPAAKKLYLKMGFQFVDIKILMGGMYEHLVFEIV